VLKRINGEWLPIFVHIFTTPCFSVSHTAPPYYSTNIRQFYYVWHKM